MATVNKDFRVKHGLAVEGQNGNLLIANSAQDTVTVKGSPVLTEASTEFLQDLVGLMVDGGTETNISVTYDDLNGKLNFVAENGVGDSTTSDLAEGTNLYFTDERAQDAAQSLFTHSGHNGIEFSYDDLNNKVTATVTGAAVPTFTSGIIFEGSTPNDFETTFSITDPTADRTITFPDLSGTVVTTGDTATVTNTMLAGSISNDKLSNSAITINGVSTSLGGSRTLGTDDVAEGSTNKYFTDERAQDAIGIAIANGTQTNISVTYDDGTNALSFNATGGVASLSGTANEVEVTNVGTAYTVGLPNDVTVSGNITINGTPTNSNHVATVAYVDAATAGLNVHDSVKAATTTNIDLATDVENGDLLDGVTLATGMRILVKNQTDKTTNGIYTVSVSGAPVRALDYNSTPEVDAGDFVFVEGGGQGKTGWVQTNTITAIGSDNIEFTQFSGAGTYQEGNGIDLTGTIFSIDTSVTVDKNTAQTLTNKTLTSPIITGPSVSGLYLTDNNIVIEGTDNTFETTVTFNDPTADRTITFKDESGTVAYISDITALTTTNILEGTNLYFTDERAQDAVGLSLGSGLSYNDTTGSISNSGVLSITGTTDQISTTSSTGSITLSLPQSINTTSTPTFAGLTLGSLTLTDALIGTAVTSLTDTNATVVDTWLASSYSSAKYVVQMKKGNDIEVIEVLVTVDGNNNVYLTEYADVISNIQLGTTDADYDSGSVRLKVTASNGTTVKVHKTLLEA